MTACKRIKIDSLRFDDMNIAQSKEAAQKFLADEPYTSELGVALQCLMAHIDALEIKAASGNPDVYYTIRMPKGHSLQLIKD